MEYWYNTKTGTVEEGKLSLSMYLIGPFASRDEAARAPEIVAQRSQDWADEDAQED